MSPRENAQHIASCVKRGDYSRRFDDCLETGRGDAFHDATIVCFLELVRHDARLAEAVRSPEGRRHVPLGDWEALERRVTPGKGERGGPCNRSACLRPGATWFNRSTRAYYCPECGHAINRANGEELCRADDGEGCSA